jgi:hypothetical protein
VAQDLGPATACALVRVRDLLQQPRITTDGTLARWSNASTGQPATPIKQPGDHACPVAGLRRNHQLATIRFRSFVSHSRSTSLKKRDSSRNPTAAARWLRARPRAGTPRSSTPVYERSMYPRKFPAFSHVQAAFQAGERAPHLVPSS